MTAHKSLAARRPTGVSSAALCTALALSGCATVQSDYKGEDTALTQASAGVTYFLPSKLIKVTASREPLVLDELVELRDAKAKALESAEAAQLAAKKAMDQAKAVLAAMGAGAAGRADREATLELKAAELAVAVKAVNKASAALDLAEAHVNMARSNLSCLYSAEVELLPAQPDLRHRFVARLRHSWMRDDTVKFKVTPAGLLSSANVVAADRTGDIIAEAAGAISGLGGRGVSDFRNFRAGPELTRPPCAPATFVQIVDPTQTGDVEAVSKAMQHAEMGFELHAQGIGGSGSASTPDIKSVANALGKSWQGALFYRSPAPMKIWLVRTDGVNAHVADASIVMVPQAGPIGFIPLNSSVFVKTVDDVQFVDGVIAGWDTDRPSEVLEIVRLPVKVAKSIISIPGELLSLKVDYSSSAKALAEAQTAEIENQRALLKLKTCLAAADAAGASADACLAAGS